MMSAAILLTAVGEQGNVRTVSAEQGGPEGDSFASSLSARIDDTTTGQGKSLSVAGSLILPGSETVLPAKKPDGVMNLLAGLEAGSGKEPLVVPGSSADSFSKSSGVKNVVTPQLSSTGAQSAKTQENQASAEIDDSPEVCLGDVDHSAIGDAPSHVDSVTGTAQVGIASARVAESDLFPVSSVADVGVDRQVMKTSGKAEEISSPLGSARIQVAQTGGAKSSSKTHDTGRASHAAEPAIAMRDTAADINAVSVQAACGVITPQSKGDNVTNWDSDVKRVAGGSSLGVASSATPVVVRKQVGSAKGDDVDPRAVASAQGDDLDSLPKGHETAARSSPASVIDIERKPQGGTEPVANVIHTITATGTVAVATGVVLPTSAVGDLSGAKSTVAPTLVHEAAPAGGLGERDAQSILAMPSDGLPQTLTATPTALEVGIQDGTHGWLRVRAEMTDGGPVNASVSVTSSAAQEMLHRELPSLTAYLQEEKVAVNTVVVHAPVSSVVEQRSFAGADAAGGQAAKSGSEGEERRQYASKTVSGGSDEAVTHGSLLGFEEDRTLQHGTYLAGGSWLSVRA